ncbi:cytochrome c1 [Magnetospira thiophila]
MRKTALAAIAALALGVSGQALASGDTPHPEAQQWSFNGLFGQYDQAQLKRGFQIFKEVCNNCHSLNLIAYRNLSALGFDEDQIKELAAEYEVRSGPNEDGEELNDDGEFLTRPALPSDRFHAPFPNPQAAMASNGGALPPDLSLMAKARKGGPDYIFALMTGYLDEAPEEHPIPEDKSYNTYFPGHAISMAPPLYDEAVEYDDGTPMTLDQHARDVAAFLNWAAEPELDERKSLGLKVLIFLAVFSAMMYALKRQIWSDVH